MLTRIIIMQLLLPQLELVCHSIVETVEFQFLTTASILEDHYHTQAHWIPNDFGMMCKMSIQLVLLTIFHIMLVHHFPSR